MSDFTPEHHRQHRYEAFCALYNIRDVALFTSLYDIDDLERFLPLSPTPADQQALQQLVGITGNDDGYMDYAKSQNAFELILQWQELTGNHDRNAMFLKEGGDLRP